MHVMNINIKLLTWAFASPDTRIFEEYEKAIAVTLVE